MLAPAARCFVGGSFKGRCPLIAVYGRSVDALRDAVRARLPGERVEACATPLDLLAAGEEVEAVLGWRMPKDVLIALPALRLVQQAAAGVEDLAAMALPDRIRIARIVDQFGPPMAEYVLAYLLRRVQRMDAFAKAQRAREWNRQVAPQLLSALCVGVAGLGSIGSEVARVCHQFGMRVIGYSRTGATAAHLPLDHHVTAKTGALREVAHEVDALIVVLPLTPATHHVVDEAVLSALGPDGMLINIGRGALVDEPALVRALTTGELGQAVLDVFEEEPLPQASPLWHLPQVTITPHVSGLSRPKLTADLFADNLRRSRAGLPLLGEIDRTIGY